MTEEKREELYSKLCAVPEVTSVFDKFVDGVINQPITKIITSSSGQNITVYLRGGKKNPMFTTQYSELVYVIMRPAWDITRHNLALQALDYDYLTKTVNNIQIVHTIVRRVDTDPKYRSSGAGTHYDTWDNGRVNGFELISILYKYRKNEIADKSAQIRTLIKNELNKGNHINNQASRERKLATKNLSGALLRAAKAGVDETELLKLWGVALVESIHKS